ncbi:DUF397 domain-containing protein [Kitasatospora acidiphila]|uniref:DUF397 domain-containing protein n=1 Tax=Kitasatospora acidiphila TaxID=2567942 RepID=A0A540VYN3_9ACTN|nr:DUF397 domain-containing protein [Kitasatospora acidiphila]TQF01869.1 DUF397 domain-containing protein [Kitasatospora acidiphila]
MSQSKRVFSAQELAAVQWYAAPGDTDGPQVAFMADGYVVWRHGGDPQAPVLVFDQGEWEAFQAGAAAGEFQDLVGCSLAADVTSSQD